jgi:predicted GNAT family acetyltransferase
MRLVEHGDVDEFLASAGELLAADEARHNLMYGICSTLVDAPDAYPEAYFWTVGNGEPLAALLHTPPFNIVVARPLDEDALRFAARGLREQALPGVTGALPEVDVFAHAWGGDRHVRMRQGIYAARSVHPPSGVSGSARPASLGDLALVTEWVDAFAHEAIHEGPHGATADAVQRRLRSKTSGFVLWEDESEPVSLCGYGGRTPHGIRIGPVYTPPELRGRGYGSAVTASVSKQQLDSGRDFCFLYTDLTNPTSNKIYTQIGYSLVCESADYAFEGV